MIKRLEKYIYVAFAFLALSACESVDDFSKVTQKYVGFEVTSASFNESVLNSDSEGNASSVNNTYEVVIYRSTTDYTEALTITMTSSAVYASNSDFASAGDDASALISYNTDISSLTFAAGEVEKRFTVTSTEDLESAGDITINFEITSVSSSDYTIGYAEAGLQSGSMTLTVIDDDCPINIPNDWEGDYNVEDFCAAPGSFNDGFCRNDQVGQTVTLTADLSDPLGLSAELSGGILAGTLPITFNTCPGTVSFSGTYNLSFTQNSATATIFPSDEPAVFGSSTFDDGSKTINLLVSYGNTSGSNFDEFIIVLKKN